MKWVMLSNSYLEKSADNSKKFDAKTILALGGFTKNLKSSLNVKIFKSDHAFQSKAPWNWEMNLDNGTLVQGKFINEIPLFFQSSFSLLQVLTEE